MKPRALRELAERLAAVPLGRLADALDVAEGRAVAVRNFPLQPFAVDEVTFRVPLADLPSKRAP